MISFWKRWLGLQEQDIHFEELWRGALYTLFARGMMMLVSFLLTWFTVRYYGTASLGLVAFISTLMLLAGQLSRLGIDLACLRLMPAAAARGWSQRRIFLFAIGFLSLSSLLMAFLLYGLAPFILERFFDKIELLGLFQYSLFFLLPLNLSYAAQAALRSLRLSAWYSFFAHAATPSVSLLLLLAGLLFTHDSSWPLYASNLALLLSALWSLWLSLRKLPAGINAEVKAGFDRAVLWAESRKLFWSALVFGLEGYLPLLVLAAWASEWEIGIMNGIQKIAYSIGVLLMAVNSMTIPKVVELNTAEKKAELQVMISRSTRTIFRIGLLLWLLICLLAPQLLGLLGQEFIPYSGALRLLAFAQLVNVATGSAGVLLNYTEHAALFARITLAGIVLAFLLCICLVPRWQVEGAVWGLSAALIFRNLLMAYMVKRRLGIITYIRWHKKREN